MCDHLLMKKELNELQQQQQGVDISTLDLVYATSTLTTRPIDLTVGVRIRFEVSSRISLSHRFLREFCTFDYFELILLYLTVSVFSLTTSLIELTVGGIVCYKLKSIIISTRILYY
jgi:hypothetical protein